MNWRALITVLSVAAGCNGQESVEGSCAHANLVAGSSPTTGAALVETGWLCTTSMADASRPLPSCSTEPEIGASCVQQATVDTTNPSQAPHYTVYPECFACTKYGTGVDWTCGTSGWQAGGTFSCSP